MDNKQKLSPVGKLFRDLKHAKNIRELTRVGSRGETLRITYQKKNGKVVKRTISPYEIKPHRTSGNLVLYATDNKHGSQKILSLLLSNIQSVESTGKRFKPRWPVLIKEKQRPVKPWRRFLKNLSGKSLKEEKVQ